jgi:hypothetical protein
MFLYGYLQILQDTPCSGRVVDTSRHSLPLCLSFGFSQGGKGKLDPRSRWGKNVINFDHCTSQF